MEDNYQDTTNTNYSGNQQRIIEFIKRNKVVVLITIGIFLFLIFSLLFTLVSSLTNENPSTNSSKIPTNPSPVVSVSPRVSFPTAIPSSSNNKTQQPFHVISTFPGNGDQNVSSGEILISINTDVPIISQDSFSLNISPQLPYYWKIINSYPTKQIQAQVYGMLNTNTQYTVVLSDKNNTPVYTWSFTTSPQSGESSSQLEKDQHEKTVNQYYPLFDYIPYNTADFSVDYTDKLTLIVNIKNPNVDQVKQEVLSWIRSHNVDPATHTINYVNSF